MPRLTAEQWAIARAKWEADPVLTFEDVGKEFGISKQAVQKRAASGGWVRKTDGLAQLAARAHARADKLSGPPKIEVTPEDVQREVDAGHVPVNQRIDKVVDQVRPAAEASREDVRAKVLQRHRDEGNAPRKLAYEALQSKDQDKMRLAKMAMETFRGIHELERKAWGLDAGEQAGGDKVIVIDRG